MTGVILLENTFIKEPPVLTTRPHLLLTNDDGISAPGLKHLWQALHPHYDLTIVAPATEQSGIGVSITTRSPLHVSAIHWENNATAWSVTGTPADCVKIARSKLLKTPPTLIIAGINRGTNSGRNVIYSGTIGGVIEGLMRDIPGIAFSSGNHDTPDYSTPKAWIPSIIDHILSHPLPLGTLLNVNFPPSRYETYRGIKMTRQGKAHLTEHPQPHGQDSNSFWLGCKLAEFEEHQESDVYWLNQGYVTAVPIHIHELTDLKHYSANKDFFEREVEKSRRLRQHS